jgi:hypothetical protein
MPLADGRPLVETRGVTRIDSPPPRPRRSASPAFRERRRLDRRTTPHRIRVWLRPSRSRSCRLELRAAASRFATAAPSQADR